jgi:hypothetical protein
MNDIGAGSGDATQIVESDREAAGRELARAATTGGLTLGEYAERAMAIQQAATGYEIQAALRGLPEQAAGVASARLGRWVVAVLGGARQGGRWRLDKHLRVVAVLGGAKLDLARAEPEAPESTVTVIAILGGADILAPQGVSVQLSGLSLLGGKADRRTGGPPLPSSPLVRVRAFTFLGGVAVKDSAQPRNLLEAIRSARPEPTGS